MNTPLTDAVAEDWPPEVFWKGGLYDPEKLDPDGTIHSETPRCILGEREYLLTRNWNLYDFIYDAGIWRTWNGLTRLSYINDKYGRDAVLEALRDYEYTIN